MNVLSVNSAPELCCYLFPLLLAVAAAGQSLPLAELSLEKLNDTAGTGIFRNGDYRSSMSIAADAKPAYVSVKFRVDKAVRGCNAGDEVTIVEWAELWVRGDRYRKGQRVLIFLYPPSQTGFSSPVAGDVGTFMYQPWPVADHATTGPDSRCAGDKFAVWGASHARRV